LFNTLTSESGFVQKTGNSMGPGYGALAGGGTIHHSNELFEYGKPNTVECLCETICSLIVCADPANLNISFIDLLLDVADVLRAIIRERFRSEGNGWLVILEEVYRLCWSLL
jgi:hypothetical protein